MVGGVSFSDLEPATYQTVHGDSYIDHCAMGSQCFENNVGKKTYVLMNDIATESDSYPLKFVSLFLFSYQVNTSTLNYIHWLAVWLREINDWPKLIIFYTCLPVPTQ